MYSESRAIVFASCVGLALVCQWLLGLDWTMIFDRAIELWFDLIFIIR
jgi:hypothetical protein